MNTIDSIVTAAQAVWTLCAMLAVTVLGFIAARKLFRKIESGDTRNIDQLAAEYDREGREVDLQNNMRGTGMGWHNRRGSGLRR